MLVFIVAYEDTSQSASILILFILFRVVRKWVTTISSTLSFDGESHTSLAIDPQEACKPLAFVRLHFSDDCEKPLRCYSLNHKNFLAPEHQDVRDTQIGSVPTTHHCVSFYYIYR